MFLARKYSVGSFYRQSSGKRTSLSVLSPFDEAEEWTKILEILNSCDLGSAENGAAGEGGSDGPHLLDAVQREFQNRLGELRFSFS